MGALKYSVNLWLLAASLSILFAPTAQAGLSGTELALMSLDIVHKEALAAENSSYGQCVACDFDVRNDRENPSKLDLLYGNVSSVAALVASKGGDFTKEKLEYVVKKILATQCGDKNSK
jgi:hypothetical protein